MRATFVLYLALIGLGLTLYIVVGLLAR